MAVRRRRKLTPSNTLHSRIIGISLLGAACLYLYFLIQTQFYLDNVAGSRRPFSHRMFLPRSFGNNNNIIEKIRPSRLTPPDRFIIFLPIQYDQGVGNIISGLLSAHLLGEEFDRIVCVSPEYEDFLLYFQPIHPDAVKYCPQAIAQSWNQTTSNDVTVRLVTYEQAPNECELQKKLKDGPSILFFIANTYPRWPKIPQQNYFFQYYRAKSNLLEALPYSKPPTTVAHLRQADGVGDVRKGLDTHTLQALGNTLPRDTFLVTNRVEWYDYFSKNYGWSHPEWNSIVHSAIHKEWGNRQGFVQASYIEDFSKDQQNIQNLQMWVDWYTILTARTVYHTHSDFSISAIHWNDIADTKTILGYDSEKQSLLLVNESWRVDGETAPMVKRTLTASGTTRLRLCGQKSDGNNPSYYRKHLEQYERQRYRTVK